MINLDANKELRKSQKMIDDFNREVLNVPVELRKIANEMLQEAKAIEEAAAKKSIGELQKHSTLKGI